MSWVQLKNSHRADCSPEQQYMSSSMNSSMSSSMIMRHRVVVVVATAAAELFTQRQSCSHNSLSRAAVVDDSWVSPVDIPAGFAHASLLLSTVSPTPGSLLTVCLLQCCSSHA